jgi:hypothetical protein
MSFWIPGDTDCQKLDTREKREISYRQAVEHFCSPSYETPRHFAPLLEQNLDLLLLALGRRSMRTACRPRLVCILCRSCPVFSFCGPYFTANRFAFRVLPPLSLRRSVSPTRAPSLRGTSLFFYHDLNTWKRKGTSLLNLMRFLCRFSPQRPPCPLCARSRAAASEPLTPH